MRKAEKERKKCYSWIPFILNPGKKILKKIAKKFKIIKKPLSGIIFKLKRDEIGWEREKNILGPNSTHTGPRQENFEKLDVIGREREKKILVPNSVHTRPGQENSKKIEKKIKKVKNLFQAWFLAKTGWDRPRKRQKIFVPNSFHTRPG